LHSGLHQPNLSDDNSRRGWEKVNMLLEHFAGDSTLVDISTIGHDDFIA
jgi:hypothetical protein